VTDRNEWGKADAACPGDGDRVPEGDLLSPSNLRDPGPLYDWLRRKPIHWSQQWRGWIASSYAECAEIIGNVGCFSSQIELRGSSGPGPSTFQHVQQLAQWVSFLDPPMHTRVRRFLGVAFRRGRVEELRPLIEEAARRRCDALPVGEPIDFLARFAFPFPVTVIASMLGLPEEDHGLFEQWSRDILPLVLGGPDVVRHYALADSAFKEMSEYFTGAIEKVSASPGEDLISDLVMQRHDGDRLNVEEVVACCMIVLFGGHETSKNLLAHALLALADHPDQEARLRRSEVSWPSAVDEFLRFDGPTKGFLRHCRKEVEISDQQLNPGDRVMVLIGAANRDPDQFLRPDQLDLGRSPNHHLEFGRGIHHCIGAPLAKLEARVALSELMSRFSTIDVDRSSLQWAPTVLSRSLDRCFVTLSK
jgi:cytochrome P450